MKKSIVTSLILLIAFSTNAQGWWGKKIRGNGNVITKHRTTQDYDAVAVGSSFDVELIKGKEGKITITGEENIIPYLITEVKGNTLKIHYKKNTNISTRRKLTVTVPFTEISSVSLGGSGNIRAKNTLSGNDISFNIGGSGNITADVDAKEIYTRIGGSGNIKLTGKTTELDCSIAGSGNIKAYNLKTEITTANIAGSGDVRTYVSKKIKARVVGSGNIYYKGNPSKVDSKSLGS